METAHAEVIVHIDNTPEVCIDYIADVRNRTLFLSMLKSVSDLAGEPSAVGTTWRWTAAGFGMEFEGIGRCLEHEPGRKYVTQTEGGIEGTVTYRAEPENDGTKLTIEAECRVPGGVVSRLPAQRALELLTKSEAERIGQSLKVILDRS